MRKLLRFIRPYKKESIIAPLFKLFEATLELFVPLVIASLIDVGIANKDISYVWKMGGILLALAAIGLTASLTAQYFAAKAAVGFAADIKSALFRHIEKLTYADITGIGTDKLITRMTSDVNQVQSGVNLVLRLFLRSPFVVVGAMVMAFTIDFRESLIFLIVILCLSLVVFGIMMVGIKNYKAVQESLDDILRKTRETLLGVRVIKAFNKEQEEIESFVKKNERYYNFQVKAGRMASLMNPMTFAIVNGGLVVLLWTGAVKVDTGVLTQGQVVALVNYMASILVELVKLANLILSITKAIASGNRIQDVFDYELINKDADKNNQSEMLVSAKNMTFRYQDASEDSLRDISFEIMRGKKLGIVGGTGAGKTTIVNLLAGFYDNPGIEISGKVSLVPQKAVLFYGTVRSNMKLARENVTDEEIWKALETADAAEFVRAADGLDTLVERGGNNFSGGQKQRLSIARALVAKSDILVLDDSFSALDYLTEARIKNNLFNQYKDKSFVIISQRTGSLIDVDNIIVLEDGQMVGSDSHEELLKNCDIYREIFVSQYGEEALNYE
ncbi:ABC transporter ATP-binding protein [Eubacterium xylanophilum]|uniref:ABC transporter ATP-binding protein n=1 Tax=Eubacterium xylanophilum TaxID=39497 RepID=UPI00047B1226|nr:ABC transporter ATP-binding protein [Eubacterium xylanophilum]